MSSSYPFPKQHGWKREGRSIVKAANMSGHFPFLLRCSVLCHCAHAAFLFILVPRKPFSEFFPRRFVKDSYPYTDDAGYIRGKASRLGSCHLYVAPRRASVGASPAFFCCTPVNKVRAAGLDTPLFFAYRCTRIAGLRRALWHSLFSARNSD